MAMENKINFLKHLCFSLTFLGIMFIIIPILDYCEDSPASNLSIICGVLMLIGVLKIFLYVLKLQKLQYKIIDRWHCENAEVLSNRKWNYKMCNVGLLLICLLLGFGLLPGDINLGLLLIVCGVIIAGQQNLLIEDYINRVSHEVIFTEKFILYYDEMYGAYSGNYVLISIEIVNKQLILEYLSIYSEDDVKKVSIDIPYGLADNAVDLHHRYSEKFLP